MKINLTTLIKIIELVQKIVEMIQENFGNKEEEKKC